MARVSSPVSRFKAVESALREATNGYRTVLEEVDAALANTTHEEDLAFLRSFREGCADLHARSRELYNGFVRDVPLGPGRRKS